jgi:hypothetical protein
MAALRASAEITRADARLCGPRLDAKADIDLSTLEGRRQLIAAAAAKLHEGGKVVSACTLQTALRQHLGVEMTLREIIEARRSRDGPSQRECSDVVSDTECWPLPKRDLDWEPRVAKQATRQPSGCDNEYWPTCADEYWPTLRCLIS